MIDYTKPTPETDAFMAKIDGDEIDLEMVRSVLHDMERQRDTYHDALKELMPFAREDYDYLGEACTDQFRTAIENALSALDKTEAHASVTEGNADTKPMVVCLCGSTRFRAEIAEANRTETMEGKIVLAPGVFAHSGDPLTDKEKILLDALHLRKIDMADEVKVVCPGGYIGESTLREIEYATRTGKPISYSHNVTLKNPDQHDATTGERNR